MDFSASSQAKVSELAGPLNGVLVEPAVATPDQLFAYLLGSYFRSIPLISGPKLRVVLSVARKNRNSSGTHPNFTPSQSLDSRTFSPSEPDGETDVWSFDSFGLAASERAHRIYRASLLMTTAEATEQLSKELPGEVLLDLLAYSLVMPTLIGKPLDNSLVSAQIQARTVAKVDLSKKTTARDSSIPILTSPRSRPYFQADKPAISHVPAEALSGRKGFTISQGEKQFYTTQIVESERSFIATLSQAINQSSDVTVAINYGDGTTGPYLRVQRGSDRSRTAYLVSNYDLWEPNENWFEGVLTNIEWMALHLDVQGRVVYRKSWGPIAAPWHIANAVAMLMTNVFDIYREGPPQVLFLRDSSLALDDFINSHDLRAVGYFDEDQSVAADFVMSSRLMAPEPQHATSSPGIEGSFARRELLKALSIAEEHDDEVGMYTLGDLVDRLIERFAFEQPWMNEISDIITGRPSDVFMLVDDFFDRGGGSRHVTDIAMFSDSELWRFSETSDAALFEMVRRDTQ